MLRDAPAPFLFAPIATPALLVVAIIILSVAAGCRNAVVAPDLDVEEAPVEDVPPLPGGDEPVTIMLGSTDLTLDPGDTLRIHVDLIGANGKPAKGKTKWSTSDASVATVDDSGLVTAVAPGEATIYVSSGSASSSVDIGVRSGSMARTATIVVAPDQENLSAIGEEAQLTAKAYDDQGNPILDPSISWSSLHPSIAAVDGKGKVLAKAAGMALVVAASGVAVDTAVVAVQQVAAAVSLTPESATIDAGTIKQFTASARDASGTVIEGAHFFWASSSETVARVDEKGMVSGVAPGEATIKVSSGDESATAVVVVLATAPEEDDDPLDSSDPDPNAPSTWIYPGDDIQAKVDAHSAGATFLIKAGVHRLQTITPRDGQEFVGEDGAVLNGAKLLTDWKNDGGRWWVEDRDGIRKSNTSDRCRTGYPRCHDPVDLFVDDEPLLHVGSLGEVHPGAWFFDYDAGRIYVGTDPTGKQVERSVSGPAFGGSATGVTIRNLQIEKYATRFQEGAIHGNATDSWVVEDNVIRLNHGVGLRIGASMRVRDNRVLSNGQLGVGGVGDDVLVEGNEIAYNNYAGVSPGWEAGGTKFVKTDRLVVRDNYVHHNGGPGLWTDIDNINSLYEDNLVEDNEQMGIFHEISYAAVIRNNTVRRNGFGKSSWLWGSGILVAGSPDVEIYGNFVEDNANGIGGIQQVRGDGAHGPHKLRNLWVHGNTVRMTSGRSGVVRDDGDDEVFSEGGNNRFDSNTYYVTDPGTRWFEWENGSRSWERWQEYNQDPNGSFKPR